MTTYAQKIGKFTKSDLRIGGISLKGRAFLAPMAGITDIGMRRLAHRFGASLTVTEMVAAGHFSRGDAANKLKADGRGLDLFAVQIAGCDPHLMAEAGRCAENAGAALIDINMGCPAKAVTNGFAGSHLMRDLKLAIELIRATVKAVRIPVSLKMRLGWDAHNLNAVELGRLAEAEGIAMLTVHGRTRAQFFTGQADWRAIGVVKRAVSIPVVANGDCTSLEDATHMLAQSDADAVMIGRAAIGQPWLIGDVARFLADGEGVEGPSASMRHTAALEHFETLLEVHGVSQGVRQARKHLAAYAEKAGIAQGAVLRQRLVRLECPNEIRAVLAQLFEEPRLRIAA